MISGEARRVRGIRGATTVDGDDAAQIAQATNEMLDALLQRNDITRSDVVSAVFTVTPDLPLANPARGARDGGWSDVPMLCVAEAVIISGVPKCIRVLLHVEMPRSSAVRHVYLRGAKALRPDLA